VVTPSVTATAPSSHSQHALTITLAAIAREARAASDATSPMTTPVTAYAPASRWGAKLVDSWAARAGTATSGTVISAPMAAANAVTARHPIRAHRPLSTGTFSRSAQIAPAITEVAAVQVAQARLETHTPSSVTAPRGAPGVTHATIPSP
jgi:hypothetical protein